MPNTEAAKKALRQTKKRTTRNIVKKKRVKESLKNAVQAIEEKTASAEELVKKAYKDLDKAAKKRTIHPNKAARLKGAIQKKLNSIKK